MWSRTDALEVLDALAGSSIAVLGGDVLSKRDDRFEHAYAYWHSDRREGEPAEEFVARSLAESRAYLSSYPDPDDGSIAYVLVFSQTV